jgi:sterol desaturase/sphingolipid hydroxylase (fatty acid hydroxylase superfamily)
MLSQSSWNSTKGYSHHYETLKKIIKQETARYLSKGYGLVVAILISLSFFIFIPYFVKDHWGTLISLAEGNEYFIAIFFYVEHHVYFVISNSMMNFLYRFKIPFFERYRVYPDKPWPWEEGKEKWRDQRNKTVKFLLFNFFILIPAALCIGFKKERVTFRYDAESFPNLTEILPQIIFIMICDDFGFYWLHRLFHLKALYPFIHKIHHEYNNTVAFASEYVHPFDYLANFFPFFLPISILGRHVHMLTIAMYLTIRYFETVDDHCGFDFSWSPYRSPYQKSRIYNTVNYLLFIA